jgi:hypothetical protein
MGFWIGLLIGVVVGATIGMVILSWCVAAKNEDRLRGYDDEPLGR